MTQGTSKVHSCCGLSNDWNIAYAAPGYGVWLTFLVMLWSVMLVSGAYSYRWLIRMPAYVGESFLGSALMWSLLASVAALVLKLLIITSWWETDETSADNICAYSFACAEVRHEVSIVWPLTRQSLDFVELVTLLALIGTRVSTIYPDTE